MIFSSFEFLFWFLPVVLVVYYSLNQFNLFLYSKAFLLVASLFFYGYFKINYLLIIFASILVNYFISNLISGRRSTQPAIARKLFVVGIVFNLLLLGYFKYIDFLIDNMNFFLEAKVANLGVLLPLGISFFTLQQIAFLVDTYEGVTNEKNFIDYSLFVSFFPQLIAGPIVHHKTVIPQLKDEKNKKINYKSIIEGIFLISMGLVKKSVVADSISKFVSFTYTDNPSAHFSEAWVSSICYSLQLYYDFSGYSDMAVGAAKLCNIDIPSNFNSPFRSFNVQEFWKRWHITLSSFITTYMYTPIVRSFKKITYTKSMFATFVAMTIAGIWHGAAWTYAVFGVIHALGLVFNQFMKQKKIRFPKPIAAVSMFFFIVVGFSVFRANNLGAAGSILKEMFVPDSIVLPFQFRKVFPFLENWIEFKVMFEGLRYSLSFLILSIFILIVGAIFFKNSNEIVKLIKPKTSHMLGIALLFSVGVMFIQNNSVFLYFNF